MTEKIGNVVLDMTYYPGEDFYSDGSIEDDILDMVKKHDKDEYTQVIAESKSWPVFYHLSPFRANIIDWLPIKKTDKVLEIGSGCGAITGALAAKAGSVTCIDLSKKRSLVNAYRNKDMDNITIMVGNFKDIEPHLPEDYDYVFLIGVFEYGQAYIGGQTPYEDFMAICNRHRSDKGRLVIAIENKFGLKYWAGCREDHLGTYFSGLEGYHEGGAARTFTRKGLEKIMKSVGIDQYSFYYPYPDYKFMNVVYSDKFLPQKGDLSNNLRNFDRDRILLFDEKQVFDQIIEEGEFPLFSNSYMVVIGKEPEVVYAKFSNDRAKPWAIKTAIYSNPFGDLRVEKIPASKEAVAHVEHTAKCYKLLSERYKDTKVVIGPNKLKDGVLQLSYCQGRTLEDLLDEKLNAGDKEGFKALIDEYMKWLSYGEESNVSNIDFIFSNIIVKDDKWQVIDYEWTFERHVPAKEIAFRAFYNYLLGSVSRKECKQLLMGDILGLSEKEIASNVADERDFQHHINGQQVTVGDMREIIGYKAYDVKVMEETFAIKTAKYISQIFMDNGSGFSEENSVIVHDAYENDNNVRIEMEVPEGTLNLRIDPSNFPCDVTIRKISMDDKIYSKDEIVINGEWIEDDNILFATTDPNMTISCEGKRNLTVELEVLELSLEAAQKLVPKNTKKRKLF